MNLRPIRTKKDYRAALEEIGRLMGSTPKRGADADKLEVLALLVEAYEKKHVEIPPPDPIDAISFRMEQGGLTREDLGALLGASSGRVSEIMTGKQQLSPRQIRLLHDKWGIPLESLYKESKRRKPGKRGRKKRRDADELAAG